MQRLLRSALFFCVGCCCFPAWLLAQGRFGDQIIITSDANGPEFVYAADLDGDGDLDVLSSASGNMIVWYANLDGRGRFGSPQVITAAARGAWSVYAADLDGDVDLDVLSASRQDDTIAWYANLDGRGRFGSQQVITTAADGASSVYAADLDGDGDLDVLSASPWDDTIAWYANLDGQGRFGEEQVITAAARGAYSVYAADLDGDGDLDVLSASWKGDTIAWYANLDGRGRFGPQQVITTAAVGAESVYAADLDGDGDLDVLSASHGDDKIAWYANLDGRGRFGSQQVITTTADAVRFVYAADLDGDVDVDVLSAWGEKVVWYANLDGRGRFGSQQVITTAADGVESVYAADLDGDGDLDVLSASWRTSDKSKLAWYRNRSRLAVSPTALEFDSVAIGLERTMEMALTNKYEKSVLALELSAPAGFTLSADTLTLALGERQAITVMFTPELAQRYAGKLTIVERLSSLKLADVPVTGIGYVQPPQIALSDTAFAFGRVRVNTRSQALLTVSNLVDNSLLAVRVVLQDSAFSASPDSFEVAGMDSQEITITFGPTHEGEYAAKLILASNSKTLPQAQVHLLGQGVSRPFLSYWPYAAAPLVILFLLSFWRKKRKAATKSVAQT